MSTPVLESAAPAAAPEPPPKPAPLASRIADTLFSPTKVFEQFREGPAPWLGPVLVSVAVLGVLMAIRPLFISNRQMAEFALQKMAEMGSQTTPTVDEMERQMGIQTIVGGMATVAWMFLRVFLAAGLLALINGLLLGGRTALRPYVAVASHAFLASTVGYVVVAAMQYASGRLDLVLDATVLMNEPGPLPSAAGHVLSPFGLWLIALLALGGATVNRRRGWAATAAILLGLQFALFAVFSLGTELMKARVTRG